jgi:hypothetical protein
MTLARRFVWELMVLLICVVPYAITGDGRAIASQAVTSAIDLTGRWEGTWHSKGGSAGSSLTAVLTQLDSSLTGEVMIRDVACLPAGTVSGSVDGNTVVFGAVFAETVQANFMGTIVEGGLAIEGNYEVSNKTCAVDIGTWRVVKIAEPCDANGDGTVDGQDAIDLLRYLLKGGPSLSGYADCHKDGVLNLRDVIAIIQSR